MFSAYLIDHDLEAPSIMWPFTIRQRVDCPLTAAAAAASASPSVNVCAGGEAAEHLDSCRGRRPAIDTSACCSLLPVSRRFDTMSTTVSEQPPVRFAVVYYDRGEAISGH